jgi:hypothetical protein
MTDTTLQIESSDDGITLSQPSPSPEWSITGMGGRTDMVLIADADLPRVLRVLRQRLDQIEGESA